MITDKHGNPIRSDPTTGEKIGKGLRLGKIGLLALGGGLAFSAGALTNVFTIINKLFPDEGQLDVALVLSNTLEEPDGDSYCRYSYTATTTEEGTIEIRKHGKFFTDFFEERKIVSDNWGYYEPPAWNIALPVLDFLLANNTEDTFVISELVVDVEESKADTTTPIYLMSPSDEFATIILFNQGWGTVEECVLDFNLVNIHGEDVPWPYGDREFEHSIRVEPFSSFTRVDFSPILKTVVRDLDYLRRAFGLTDEVLHRDGEELSDDEEQEPGWWPHQDIEKFISAVEPFKFENPNEEFFENLGVHAVGTLTVKAHGMDSEIVEIAVWIPLIQPEGLGGGGLEPSNTCDIDFKKSGKAYKIRHPLALWAKPNDPLRLQLRLGGEISGSHRFRFRLLGNGKTIYTSPTIDSELVIPREPIEFLAQHPIDEGEQ